MAKQTFTTGQVLTAAQMTSLQQTAMGGGSPVVKTASYVLVAADAGTTIQMNSASSTTITVNTALFAAGDSVFIQNIGTGTCTITAGTATVTTAGSLALSQWEGGNLYFTSTSASIFFDVVQSASASGLTFITGASFTTVASVSLPNSTFTSTYTNYKILWNVTSAAGAASETRFRMRASGTDDTASNYYMGGLTCTYTGVNGVINVNGGSYINYGTIAAGSSGLTSQSTQFEQTVFSPQAAVATVFTTMGGRGSWTYTAQTGVYNASTAFDALTYYVDAGTITGNYRVYGLQNS